MDNYEKLKSNFIKNDFILLSHGINLCLFVYDWDDENTESKEKILEDLDKKISSYMLSPTNLWLGLLLNKCG